MIWFKDLGFDKNPFSTKPANFSNNETMIKGILDKISHEENIGVFGGYGSGKTSALKEIIHHFGGKRRVIYHSCNKSDKRINFESLIRGSGNILQRLFGIKRKGLILLLDEVQDIKKKDLLELKYFKEVGYFSSIIFVSKYEDLRFVSEIEAMIDSKFVLGNLSEEKAIEAVREKVGNIEALTDKKIKEIYAKEQNPRRFFKLCEEECRSWYGKQ